MKLHHSLIRYILPLMLTTASAALYADDLEEYQLNYTNLITASQALAIAQEHSPGIIIELELESHRNLPLWEVSILSESNTTLDIVVDARTGDIITDRQNDSDD